MPPSSTPHNMADNAPVLLLRARAWLLTVEMILLLAGMGLLEAHLPWEPLLTLWSGHFALVLALAIRGRDLTQPEAALHLTADAALLAGLVFFTGGYANPCISLLLLPLVLGAVTLRDWQIWLLALWVGLLYTVLMRHYQPLVLELDSEAAVDLHLAGMWLSFLLTAILVAAFVGALSSALRRRDASLAKAREERLRDEQLFALGMQAASAAHDMATPLASVRLALDNLREDYSGDEELSPTLNRISNQLERVENVLQQLCNTARSPEAPSTTIMNAGIWLERAIERWGLLHPAHRIQLVIPEDLPNISAEPALESVFVTLLNNAAEASTENITVTAQAEKSCLKLEIRDRGTGLGVEKTTGWGVGLDLARATVGRMGGSLVMTELPGAGVAVQVTLPVGRGS